MRYTMNAATMAGIALAGALLAVPAHAQQGVNSDIPDSLAKQAKITEATARATATRRVPNGQIKEVELEREHGHLQYSYDVVVPGKTGVTEVSVDAVTGKVLNVHTESVEDESKEAAQEKKSPN